MAALEAVDKLLEIVTQQKDDDNKTVDDTKIQLNKWSQETVNSDKLILHIPPRSNNIANNSPPCAKLEAWMNLLKLKYEVDCQSLITHPITSKFPWITWKGEHYADSNLIMELLTKKMNLKDIDSDLTLTEKAVSSAFQSMVENEMYWLIVYNRYDDTNLYNYMYGFNTSNEKNEILLNVFGPLIKKQLYQQGMGRFNGDDVYGKWVKCMNSIVAYLNKKNFFFGDKISLIDIVIYGTLSSQFQLGFKWPKCSKQHPSLVHTKVINQYMKRVEMQCWGKITYWKDIDNS